MKTIGPITLLIMTLCTAAAWGQSNRRAPRIGYLYPAGGQQGTVFRIMAGGQQLKGVERVHLSGEGVHASVVRYMGQTRRLNGDERRELGRRLLAMGADRLSDQPEVDRFPMLREWIAKKRLAKAPSEPVELPTHPLLNNLEDLSAWELEFVVNELLRGDKKKQPNQQISETVLIEVVIDEGTAPGDRLLRLETPVGLTNPMCFQVGVCPEVREQDPYDAGVSPTPPINPPAVLNGQIKPGDVDRFSIHAEQGQRLVMETCARHLVPYLADAVPGWFQATLALYDDQGNEVAFADDYRFHPDPVLFFQIPATGVYDLEIRDAIYRGREDFVYRITVGEQPFITSLFPLGGQAGGKATASIHGWNLDRKRLPLDTRPGDDRLRETVLHEGGSCSNPVTYAVDTLPEYYETEPNDTSQDPQRITLPCIVNGCLTKAGEADVFRFKGRRGEVVVAEVHARRLGSPLDSLLQLIDGSGRVLDWNDDSEDLGMGLLTHHADSYLRTRLPKSGAFFVRLTDTQHHGGEGHGYRLRISPPRPDFSLRMTPSSLNIPAGRTVPICIQAIRKDGFDGDIELLLSDEPDGFTLSGGRIPGTRDRISVTLTAPRRPLDEPVVLRLEGRATMGDQLVSRSVIPSDDMMQAFIYRHLVPVDEFVVSVTGSKIRMPPFDLDGAVPLRVPRNGTAEIQVHLPRRKKRPEVQLELREPAEGLVLQEIQMSSRNLSFDVKADGDALQPGFKDNLIIEIFTEVPSRRKKGKTTTSKQRISLGVLPAIPFEIVRR